MLKQLLVVRNGGIKFNQLTFTAESTAKINRKKM